MKNRRFWGLLLSSILFINVFWNLPAYAGNEGQAEAGPSLEEVDNTEEPLAVDSEIPENSEQFYAEESAESMQDSCISDTIENLEDSELDDAKSEGFSEDEMCEEDAAEEMPTAEDVEPEEEYEKTELVNDNNKTAEKCAEIGKETVKPEDEQDLPIQNMEESDSGSSNDIENIPSESDVPKAWGADLMGLPAAKKRAQYAYEHGALGKITIAVIDTGLTQGSSLLNRVSADSCSMIDGSVNYYDENGHGTHVAEIIADNTADNVELLIIKALDDDKKGSIGAIVRAVNYAVEKNAKLINLSVGVSVSDFKDREDYDSNIVELRDAINDAIQAGCVIVTSAGKEGLHISKIKSFPANMDSVITVSAINNELEKCEFSNYGPSVDYCAPGEDIYSWADQAYFSGTSMAAAYMTVICSYLASYNDVSADSVKQLIDKIVVDIKEGEQYDEYGKGLPVLNNGIVPYYEDYERPEVDSWEPEWSPYPDAPSVLFCNTRKGAVYNVYRKGQDEEAFRLIGTEVASAYFADESADEYQTYDYYIEVLGDGFYTESNISEVMSIDLSWGKGIKSISPDYFEVGDVKQIEYVLERDDYRFTNFSWSSSDENVLTVDQNGVVTAIGVGEANIIISNERRKWSFGISVGPKTSETSGDIQWSVSETEDGMKLIVDGDAVMPQYSEWEFGEIRPWNDYSEQITEVEIGDGIHRISQGAFASLPNLKRITGMKNVEYIGEDAFRWCYSLQDVVLPEPLKEIGNNAFDFCSELNTIVLPENLRRLGMYAFGGTGITEFVIPGTTTEIGIPLDDNVLNYYVSPDNPAYSSADGVLYDKSGEKLIYYPGGRVVESYTVADHVKAIGNSAFHHASVKELIISDSVDNIEVGALTGIDRILVSDENQSYMADGNGVFSKDGRRLVYYFNKEYNGTYRIPDNVVEIGEGAFYQADFSELYLPNSVKSIEKDAFLNIKVPEFKIPNSVTKIGSSAFHFCAFDTLTIGEGIQIINKDWFYGCDIAEIFFSEGVTEIGFSFCEGIENLQRVHFPSTLNTIGVNAFEGQPLVEVSFPEGVANIGTGSFAKTLIESVIIPPGANAHYQRGDEDMEYYELAFSNCPNLHFISFSPEAGSFDFIFTGCENLKDINYYDFSKVFYGGVSAKNKEMISGAVLHIFASGEINDRLMWQAEGESGDLTLTISGSGPMPDFLSAKETPWYEGREEITHVVIEDGITHIGDYAFYNFEKLQSISVPEQFNSYGPYCMRGCPELHTFIVRSEDGSDELSISPQYLVSLYTGLEIQPDVIVEHDERKLEKGIAYDVTYVDNKEIGIGRIIITFNGDYTQYGKFEVPLSIVDRYMRGENIKVLSAIELIPSKYVYCGSVCTPAIIVKSGRWTLKQGIDYALSLPAGRKQCGTYNVKAKGIGAYSRTVVASFNIAPKDISDMSARLSETVFGYNHNEHCPEIMIPGLTEGKDYKISYSDNVEPGTGYAIANGIGNYSGTLKMAFSIKENYKPTLTTVPTVTEEVTITPTLTVTPTSTLEASVTAIITSTPHPTQLITGTLMPTITAKVTVEPSTTEGLVTKPTTVPPRNQTHERQKMLTTTPDSVSALPYDSEKSVVKEKASIPSPTPSEQTTIWPTDIISETVPSNASEPAQDSSEYEDGAQSNTNLSEEGYTDQSQSVEVASEQSAIRAFLPIGFILACTGGGIIIFISAKRKNRRHE